MTRVEALEGFTRWAAYAAFQEGSRGSIEPGKQADLTVLDQDIMTIPPASIRGVKVSMTIVGGVIAYTGIRRVLAPVTRNERTRRLHPMRFTFHPEIHYIGCDISEGAARIHAIC